MTKFYCDRCKRETRIGKGEEGAMWGYDGLDRLVPVQLPGVKPQTQPEWIPKSVELCRDCLIALHAFASGQSKEGVA